MDEILIFTIFLIIKNLTSKMKSTLGIVILIYEWKYIFIYVHKVLCSKNSRTILSLILKMTVFILICNNFFYEYRLIQFRKVDKSYLVLGAV